MSINLKFGLSTPERCSTIIPRMIFTRISILVSIGTKFIFSVSELITYYLYIYKKKNPSNKKYLICRLEYASPGLPSEEIISLDQTMGGGYDVFCWDLEWSPFNSSARKFENFILSSNFELIALSSWDSSVKTFIPKRVLEKIRKNGTKVITINWDTVSKNFWLKYQAWCDDFDLNVITDNPKKLFYRDLEARNKMADKTMFLFTPFHVSEAIDDAIKDIDILLTCRVGSYRSNRMHIIKQLLCANIPGTILAFESDPIFSWSEYLKLVKRAKIVINFSQSVDGEQLKGRVWLAISEKCLLLESENDQIKCYFRPQIDYVPFLDAADLIEKIRFYSSAVEDRKKIANSAYERMKLNYSGAHFWENIEEKLNEQKSNSIDNSNYK